MRVPQIVAISMGIFLTLACTPSSTVPASLSSNSNLSATSSITSNLSSNGIPQSSVNMIPGSSSIPIGLSSSINSGTSSSSVLAQSSSSVDPTTLACGGKMPAPITNGSSGYGTRYWDCCKPTCSWYEHTVQLGTPNGVSENCSIDNEEIEPFTPMDGGTWYKGTVNGCESNGVAFTCYSQAPYAVCENLAYGYAAVPSSSPACGKCFQLDFDGKGKYDTKPAHALLLGKSMIVMASNTGGDVNSGQFDIMIPGGGVGAFSGGCAAQWNVDANNESLVGAKYGGFLTKCQADLGYNASVESYKTCVRNMCDNLFGSDPSRADLLAGCHWYVDWMQAADNPTFTYKEVPCPAELINGYKSSFY